MNDISFRKVLTCPRCHQAGYKEGKAADGRPEFTCTRCDHTWTSGKDDKPYSVNLNMM